MSLKPHIMEKLVAWRKSPLIFAHECIDWRGKDGVTHQQVEALQAITKERRISIRSGHGCGKDAIAALIALWFMSTRVDSKVVVTAPTNRQLNDIFWSELAKWFHRS
ncbi:MAG: DEAD/DEAH box helicase family protein, partial [Proteobacteria bacterium]|nr:DEAD/DEAH box helicase family protein [Pseudomonadota bacterium]